MTELPIVVQKLQLVCNKHWLFFRYLWETESKAKKRSNCFVTLLQERTSGQTEGVQKAKDTEEVRATEADGTETRGAEEQLAELQQQGEWALKRPDLATQLLVIVASTSSPVLTLFSA